VTQEDSNAEAPSSELAPWERPFDELAKGLARGTLSRRKALKLLGGALLGGLLVASSPAVASAQRTVRSVGQCPRFDIETAPDPCFTRCVGAQGEGTEFCGCTETTEGQAVCVHSDVGCPGGPARPGFPKPVSCESTDECTTKVGPTAVCAKVKGVCCPKDNVCVFQCGTVPGA
jgi:hypothetical protein